jgi:hypothetical protein
VARRNAVTKGGSLSAQQNGTNSGANEVHSFRRIETLKKSLYATSKETAMRSLAEGGKEKLFSLLLTQPL